MKAYTVIPEGKHECPVCNGTGRVPVPEHSQKYKKMTAGYCAADDTFGCRNCGGQTMSLTPRGYVSANKDGVACTHSYKSQTIGRCLTRYTCVHCTERYDIDSGD